MAGRYKVKIRVISQKGICRNEHKVGDEWIIEGKTPGGMCPSAWNALHSNVRVMMLGGSFDWTGDPDMCTVACPDPDNPLVFEVRRLRE